MVVTGAEVLALKSGLRKAAGALGKAALTGPGPGAGSVDKRVRTRWVPGLERRQKTIEVEDAERIARTILQRVSGQRFTLPGKARPKKLEIPADDIDALVSGIGLLMSALPDGRVDMAAVLEAHGEPEALADRMRAARPEAAAVVGDLWLPVLDELAGIVGEHIVEFFTTKETFAAAADLELLKRSARKFQPEEEAELLEGYTRLVREKSHKIRLFGLDLREDDQTYDLMTGFVDLTVETADRTERSPSLPDQSSERISWNRMDTLVKERSRVLLEGPAGSGKSTLMQWLTLTWLNTPGDTPTPFLIRLREFTAGQTLTLPRPVDFITILAPPYSGRLPGWELEVLADGWAAVLVDGIDEIPEQLRDEALQWLADLANAYPRAYFVVTTRPAGLAEPWRRCLVEAYDFTKATINPMSTEQVSTFIDRWHQAAAGRPHADSEELQEGGESLKQAIRWRRDLSHITTTPLLCAMVCALYRADNRALPRNRTALYERACAMLLEKRDTQQRIQTFPVALTREQIEPFLTEIALWMLINKQRSIPRADALGLVAEVLPRVQIHDAPPKWKPDAEEFLRHIVVRAGVLQEPTMELLEFVHPSFQDFLAAKGVFQKSYLAHLIENAHDPMYQDVAVMAVSHAQNDRDRQDELLERLIERAQRDGKQKRQLHLLAAACIADAAMVDPKWVKLVQQKNKTFLPPRSNREAQVLADAGEFTLDLLADVGRSRRFTTAEAAATTEAIGLLGGGGEVGMRILRTLAERFGSRISWELATAWHQVPDPQEFLDKVLVHGDFSTTCIQINSPELVPLLPALPGLRSLGLPGALNEGLPSLSIKMLRTDGFRLAALPDLPHLNELELESADIPFLARIPRFQQLAMLTIRNNPAPDLVPLTALPRLVSLTILGARRLDLAPLATIRTLSRLTLSTAEPVDLTPLAGLWNLSYLSLAEAPSQGCKSSKALQNISTLRINHLHSGTERTFPRLTDVTTRSTTHDTDDLAGFSRLTTLALFGVDRIDAGPLAAIPHLRQLDLRTAVNVGGLADLRITELSLQGLSRRQFDELKHVPQVRTLNLNKVPGRSLARLPSLPMLKNLNLWNVSEPALSELRKSTDITHLSVNLAEDTDFRGLTALPSLTDLSIGNSHAVDIGPLKQLANLEHLSIYAVKHFDRSVLRHLTGLKSLLIDGVPGLDPHLLPPDTPLTLLNMAGLTPADLANLPTLRRLTLSEEPECGLAALSIVPTIEHLTLNTIPGARTEDLAAWPALRSLSLLGTPNLDLPSLTDLPHLRELDLYGVPGDGIAALTDLEVLTLGRTGIGLSRLSALPKLRHLTLRRRWESDLSPLAKLPGLKKLELTDMPWADLTPFQARPDIEVIQR